MHKKSDYGRRIIGYTTAAPNIFFVTFRATNRQFLCTAQRFQAASWFSFFVSAFRAVRSAMIVVRPRSVRT